MKLLTLGNPKTAKGEGLGFLTAVLHLAPSNLSGIVNVCSNATAGCRASCLNTAGRGGILKAGELTNAIQQARIRRTLLLINNPAEFLAHLTCDIRELSRAARRHGLRPALRMNGTSDLNWYDLGQDIGGAWDRASRGISINGFANAFRFLLEGAAAMHNVVLYDYSKRALLFDQYEAHGFPCHLTFSAAETAANKTAASRLMRDGRNVAVVFATRKGKALPATFEGRPVIDGDKHDLRFLDPAGVVVGLRAKGRARKDATGFVVPV